MTTFLSLLLIAAMIAVVFQLVKGIIAFLRTTEDELKNPSPGPSASGLKQNKAMMNRVLFQAIAIIIVAVLLAATRG